jgi:hypothetical protein
MEYQLSLSRNNLSFFGALGSIGNFPDLLWRVTMSRHSLT